MKQRKKQAGVLLVIMVLLLGLAGYFCYSGFPYSSVEIVSNTITPEENTTESAAKIDSQATTEQRQELPDNYVWDIERLGEPPRIVYDFAENQEMLEGIMKEAEGLISEGNGFSTGYENNEPIYYYSGGKNIEGKISKDMKKKVKELFNNTKFCEITKKKSGNWFIHYDQEENSDRFIFIMSYRPGITDEQAYEEGYYRVVGDWFFGTIWKI